MDLFTFLNNYAVADAVIGEVFSYHHKLPVSHIFGVFLLYTVSVKSVTLLFAILLPCNLLSPPSVALVLIPEQEGLQAPLQSQAYAQASTLWSSFQVNDFSLQWELSIAGKGWRNGHSPSTA